MSKLSWNSVSHRLIKVSWALLFITLPVTSFPFFPSQMGGMTLVRPLAAYPLIFLVFLVTIPRFFKRPLPKTFLPLLAFFVVALISSIAAMSSDLESLRGVSLVSRFVRNLATLGLGLAFYFTVSLLPETQDDLKFSLRWLYVGIGLALLWGSFQALNVIHYSPTYFKWLNRIQTLLSSRKLFTTRISGLTFEPKWFADQICFLLYPWLLSSVILKRSLFRWRYKWITVEWILLGWATVVLFFTFSRTGLFILVGLTLLSFIFYRYLTRPVPVLHEGKPRRARGRVFLEVSLLIFSLIAIIFVVGSQNAYFSRFWRYFTEAKRRNRTYLEFIAFEQRFIYFETAFRIYETHPLVGVGLGNYAFYFDEMLPDRFYNNPEIVRQTTPVEGRDRLITPKNLYARLLAETGILGIAAFISFTMAIMGCILYLWLASPPEEKFWGLCGFFVMIVFLVVVFSYDSFALPNMWIVFGLITAAAHIANPVPESISSSADLALA